MEAERKGVDRLASKIQHARRRPPPVPPQRGHEGITTLKESSFNVLRNGLSKPTDNVGQQRNNNLKERRGQFNQNYFLVLLLIDCIKKQIYTI